jgi:hypothetical protein
MKIMLMQARHLILVARTMVSLGIDHFTDFDIILFLLPQKENGKCIRL